jgi:hypothetical protein
MRTEPFFQLLSGVDSLCMLGKQLTSVISTLDAFFTKVKGHLSLSTLFVKHNKHPVLTISANGTFLSFCDNPNKNNTATNQYLWVAT